MTFYDESKKLLKDHQLYKHYSTLDEMLKRYRKFVESLARHGYDDYLDEFENDIAVRYFIEKILDSDKLSSWKEWEIFRQKVGETDDLLRKLFIPSIERSETDKWWVKGILKNGCGNYASDIKLMYGFDITIPL